ncbi:MAG: penicillin-binding protein [Gammaproteobacteria bacterium]|nr:penicillin-binding protein [Gammaproteobacteria bacterium]
MADSDTLDALKVAFTYMPQPIEVNRFTHGDDAARIHEHITFVRETLLSLGIDPDEVAGEINPDSSPNSCY